MSDAIPRIAGRDWDTRVVPTALHIEGGSILSNGQGVTVCSSALFNQNRMFGFDDAAIERELKRVTGAQKLIIVEPLEEEGGVHVDLFMTFTDPDTIVLCESRNPNDDYQRILEENARILQSQLGDNKDFRIQRIPLPDPVGGCFKSYTNVVYANGVLLVPSYLDQVEPEVRKIYQSLLPDWKIEFIDCTRLLTKGGALHCLTSNLGDTPYQPMPSRKRNSKSVTSRSRETTVSPETVMTNPPSPNWFGSAARRDLRTHSSNQIYRSILPQ